MVNNCVFVLFEFKPVVKFDSQEFKAVCCISYYTVHVADCQNYNKANHRESKHILHNSFRCQPCEEMHMEANNVEHEIIE